MNSRVQVKAVSIWQMINVKSLRSDLSLVVLEDGEVWIILHKTKIVNKPVPKPTRARSNRSRGLASERRNSTWTMRIAYDATLAVVGDGRLEQQGNNHPTNDGMEGDLPNSQPEPSFPHSDPARDLKL